VAVPQVVQNQDMSNIVLLVGAQFVDIVLISQAQYIGVRQRLIQIVVKKVMMAICILADATKVNQLLLMEILLTRHVLK
jgi:hypothetical protein